MFGAQQKRETLCGAGSFLRSLSGFRFYPAAGIPSHVWESMTKVQFTPLQGQYLAFIHAYTAVNARPPAEADLQRHFRVTPPTVHDMILRLEAAGHLSRVPGQPRSLHLIISPDLLPTLR